MAQEMVSRDYATAKAMREIEAGTLGEGIGGAGAVVLGILGLIGIMPLVLDSVAAIALGIALVMGTIVIGTEYRRMFNKAPYRVRQRAADALALQILTGIGATVLGVLALLGIDSVPLLGVASIVLGAALLMTSSALSKVQSHTEEGKSEAGEHLFPTAFNIASSWNLLVGIGGMVLGILALSGVSPVTLTLISVLSLGTGVMITGSPTVNRVFSMLD